MRKLVAFFLGTAGVFAASTEARASTFDEQGTFNFDKSALVKMSFETNENIDGLIWVQSADAIDGAGYGRVNTTQEAVTLPLELPATDAAYRARIFVRKNRLVADVVVSYGDGASPSFDVRFFPTGVVTSDGWYELTTSRFSIEGSRAPTVALSLQATDADIDGFELVPDGAFKKLAKCSGVVDTACGVGEFCASGFCRNGETMVPPIPDGDAKASVPKYLAGRIKNFFGGRYTRATHMSVALATIGEMRRAEDAWTYWNGFMTGVRQLHDWHTSTSGPTIVEGRGAFPICVVEGDADLSHDAAPKDPKYYDVLVSHVGAKGNGGLKAGDRIVAVNGMHPFAFVESLEAVDWSMWRADDPETHAEAAERLSYAVRRWAKDITLIRCDAGARTCSAPQTIQVSELPADEQGISYPNCDHRPSYHLKTGNPDPVRHSVRGTVFGALADSAEGEDLYGMIWNSVYLVPGQNNPYEAAMNEFRAKAKGVILDHRTGNGGTEPAAEYLTQLFRTPQKLATSYDFTGRVGLFDSPFSLDTGITLFNAQQNSRNAFDVGAANARTNLPVALLLARDGSASDWFPYGLKGPKNVRLFGRRTAGAFSTFLQFNYYGEIAWQLATGDLVRADGTTHLGEGVVPDEEMVPKQSDLLIGKDTVYERALEWIRTCTECRQ